MQLNKKTLLSYTKCLFIHQVRSDRIKELIQVLHRLGTISILPVSGLASTMFWASHMLGRCELVDLQFRNEMKGLDFCSAFIQPQEGLTSFGISAWGNQPQWLKSPQGRKGTSNTREGGGTQISPSRWPTLGSLPSPAITSRWSQHLSGFESNTFQVKGTKSPTFTQWIETSLSKMYDNHQL